MSEPLDPVEARVLGVLLEKEAATPEYYPLSLNALVNACNQKSNRYPVTEYREPDVLEAVERLAARRYAGVITSGSRVHKYAQRITETLNLGRREAAVLAVLLLRGAQTLGEIRDRSERLYSFADLEEAERVLDKLAQFPSGAMARRLARQPGQKESRYVQLLSGEPAMAEEPAASYPAASGLESKFEQLIEQMAELRRRVEALERARE